MSEFTPPASVPADAPKRDLPIGQEMALLIARSGELSRIILTAMRAMGIEEPTEADHIALCEERLLTTKGYKLYALTPRGLHKVQWLQVLMARDYGIHHFRYQPKTGMGARSQCTCGYTVYAPTSRDTEMSLSKLEQDHLIAVGARKPIARKTPAELAQLEPPPCTEPHLPTVGEMLAHFAAKRSDAPEPSANTRTASDAGAVANDGAAPVSFQTRH